MYVYSEILNKKFDTVAACKAAELEFAKAQKKNDEAKAAIEAELDTLEVKIEELVNKYNQLCDEYEEKFGVKETQNDEVEDDSLTDDIVSVLSKLFPGAECRIIT